MKSDDLFKELGLGDSEMEEARNCVLYKKFENAVPAIFTLSEFVNTVMKNAINDNSNQHLWFSERYMISKYITSEVPATAEYISEMVNRINILVKHIPNETQYQHIHAFLDTLTKHLISTRCVMPKEVLEYLNKLYKTRGSN